MLRGILFFLGSNTHFTLAITVVQMIGVVIVGTYPVLIIVVVDDVVVIVVDVVVIFLLDTAPGPRSSVVVFRPDLA